MADFTYQGTVDGSEPVETVFDTSTGSLAYGDIVEMLNGYAEKVADGGCIVATSWYGLALETENSSSKVRVLHSPAGLILRGAPTTAGNLATAIKFDNVSLDVSGGVQKVDENDPNAAYALTIVDYNTTNSTIDVMVRSIA